MNTILFLRSNCNYYKRDSTKQVKKNQKPTLYPAVVVYHTHKKYNKNSVMDFITWFIHFELNHFHS